MTTQGNLPAAHTHLHPNVSTPHGIEQCETAKSLQQKRDYTKHNITQPDTNKKERFYIHPAICKNNKTSFTCETCNEKRNDSMVIRFHSKDDFKNWCIWCPTPPEHLEFLQKHKLYDEYMAMRNANGKKE